MSHSAACLVPAIRQAIDSIGSPSLRTSAYSAPYRSAGGTVSPGRAATYLLAQGAMVYPDPEL